MELDQFYKHLNTLEPTTESTKNVSIEPKLVLRQIMYKSLKIPYMNMQQKQDFYDIKNTQLMQRLLMRLFSLIPLKFSGR